MIEFDFYDYYEDKDKVKIYGEEIHNYFEFHYNIIIESIDFDSSQNVVLYIDHYRSKINFSELEKRLLKDIKHLNDVEVRNMKIILIFNTKEIELC